MTDELKSKQLSDDELEDVNGGAGIFDWLMDKKGGKKVFAVVSDSTITRRKKPIFGLTATLPSDRRGSLRFT